MPRVGEGLEGGGEGNRYVTSLLFINFYILLYDISFALALCSPCFSYVVSHARFVVV